MKDISIFCKIKEAKSDEPKMTVIAGVLEADSLSANGRFYPRRIVEEAAASLVGRPSLIGHDTDDADKIVARISEAQMMGDVLTASFKFGQDDHSRMMFEKVRDGLVDSVSIRASGETKRAKMGDDFVDVVEKLEIFSVDFVVEGGVSAARVLKVFESAPQLQYEDETKDEKELAILCYKKINALLTKYVDLVSISPLFEQIIKNKFFNHNEKLLAKSEREVEEIYSRLEDWGISCREFKERAKRQAERKSDVVIKAIDVAENREGLNFNTVNEVMTSSRVPSGDKVGLLVHLMGGKTSSNGGMN